MCAPLGNSKPWVREDVESDSRQRPNISDLVERQKVVKFKSQKTGLGLFFLMFASSGGNKARQGKELNQLYRLVSSGTQRNHRNPTQRGGARAASGGNQKATNHLLAPILRRTTHLLPSLPRKHD